MARPQMDNLVNSQNSSSLPTCRMEVLRDGRLNGGTQPPSQATRRSRTVSTQTASAPSPPTPLQDAQGEPLQDGPLRENTGTEQERSHPAETRRPFPSSSSSSDRRGSRPEVAPTPEEQVVARVAIQLRTIGDEMNAVYLQRRNDVHHWHNWRGLYRGLVAFLADTLSTLYQRRLR